VPYIGPLVYRGTSYPSSPYWSSSWWAGVQIAGTAPPALYSNPDMLVTYYLENTYEVKMNGTQPASSYFGIVAQPTFPASYPSTALTSTPKFTLTAPPDAWFERSRLVVLNGCFVGGNPGKVSKRWGGTMTCAAADRPAWLSSYHECATGGTYPDSTSPFVMLGGNACGETDPTPPELAAAVAALEAIPDPPWRHWQ
jgi:hypothetical protein